MQTVANSLTKAAKSSAYLYAILVDDVVRYVGKGRDKRLYIHVIEARRSAARCGACTTHLGPRVHRKLVEAVRAGSDIAEIVILDGLTDQNAFRLEYEVIGNFHQSRPGQLWNTIDERFMEKRFLPKGLAQSGKSTLQSGAASKWLNTPHNGYCLLAKASQKRF